MSEITTRFSKLGLGLGALLILTGMFLPPLTMATLLRPESPALPGGLLAGVWLFKASLAVIGVAVFGLSNRGIWESGESNVKARSRPGARLALGILGAILLVALGLRLYGLNAGLWLDEILTNELFAKMPFGSIITTFESENQHFLYSLLAHISIEVFGDSAWALRLPAVLFGVGSVWALYLLGREVASVREALFSAALLAFSYTHLWFSQNARGYSGLLFWTVLGSWLLLRALRERRPQFWLFYAAAVALGLYTHMTMAFVIIGHFFVYLWALFARRGEPWPNRWAGLYIGFLFAGLLSFLLYALVFPQLLAGMGREESLVAAWKNPLWTVLEVVKGLQISFAGSAVAVLAFIGFGAGLLSYARTKPEVVQLLVIAPVIGAAVVVALGHHLWPRFFLFAMGFGALVVIRGAMVAGNVGARLIGRPWLKPTWVGSGLCLGLVLVSSLSIPYAYAPKQDYLGALDFIEANKEPGDTVVTAGLASFPYEYYFKRDWVNVESTATLDDVRSQAKRTWLIYTFPLALQAAHPEIMTSIERDFQTVKRFGGTVGDGTVFVCRFDAPSPGMASK